MRDITSPSTDNTGDWVVEQRQDLKRKKEQLLHWEEMISRKDSELDNTLDSLRTLTDRISSNVERLKAEKRRLEDKAKMAEKHRKQLQRKQKKIEHEQACVASQEAALAIERGQRCVSFDPSVASKQIDRDNRRYHPRYHIEIEVSLHSSHNFYSGLTENISEGGLFIATYDDDLPVGTILEILVDLPGKGRIQAKAEVRWVRHFNQFTVDQPPGIGVQFCDLADQDADLIRQFIREREPLLYEEEC